MARIAINGFGRIGRCVLRSLYERKIDTLEVVAINELADAKTIAHLLKYDTTHGRFQGKVRVENDTLIVDEKPIALFHQSDIQQLPWHDLGIDIVFECSGVFSDRASASLHLAQGAKKVLLSQPGDSQDDVDATIIYGFNHDQLTGDERIISNGSCSTNCIVPVIHTLHQHFGIEAGTLTTIHSAMHDQPVIDAYHHTDLRKTRSAMQSIIPIDTGLARGIDRLLPELAGKFEAQALRVPTINVSAIDLTVVVKKVATAEAIKQILREAALTHYCGVLGTSDELLASCDFNHDPHSGIVDLGQTQVAGERMIKTLTWFDNEWGFSNRMVDLAQSLSD